ncbi:MAG: RteC domain-containing protein [Chitinophagaceae bacterium]
MEKAEQCYSIAIDHWQRIKIQFKGRTIQIDEEEIIFFRNVKPAFTAHIEYYLMMNQSLLFVPYNHSSKVEYWQEQEKRLKRFQERHFSFVAYYEQEQYDKDAQYFLSRNNLVTVLSGENVYRDIDCRSSHDHLVRGLLANRMYNAFAEGKLKEIKILNDLG